MDYAPMVTLEGVDGSQTPLMTMGVPGSIWLRRGAKGLDMPPWDVQVDEYPARDGEYPRADRALAREVFLPLTLWARTRPELVATKRRLLEALPPSRMWSRMAKLVTAEVGADGQYEPQRELEVYYSSGLEGDEGEENGLTWLKYGLVLRSTDPFFRDRQDTVIPFVSYEETEPFFPPGEEPFVSPDGLSGGFQLSPSPVFTTEVEIFNQGNVSVKPTWTFVGPLSGPFNLVRQATAYSPQQVLGIKSLNLAAGQSATLVTSPGQVRLTTSAGANVTWSALVTNPDFWYLDPGPNTVTIQNLPGGVMPTSVTLSYRAKYLGI